MALVAALLLRRSVETETTTRSPVPSRLQSPAQVDAALRSAQIRLNDPRVQGSARSGRRSTARVRCRWQPFFRRAEHLDEATATLDTHARSSALPLGLRFYAASELVQARSLQAERTRNAFGYTELLGLQAELAKPPEPSPGGTASPCWTRATTGCTWRVRRPTRAVTRNRRHGRPGTVPQSVTGVRSGGPLRAAAPLKIAQQTFLLTFVDPDRHHLSLPHEIRDLRETRRYFRGRRRDGYEFVELALAQLLLLAVDEASG